MRLSSYQILSSGSRFYTTKPTEHSKEELTFQPGVERPAVTFIIQVPQLEVSAVHETMVRCDHILSPSRPGKVLAGFTLW